MDEVIIKRIHISGLTPAITSKDLSDRLASFGTVKAIDGFGALDSLGQPRKFAYATLETTKGKLARCMNLLSGVTWKGTKMRLGEAKPDFRERIAQEQAELKRADGEPPKKRRRLHGVQGVHAYDMSLVTPDNVATRGGWRVTQTGRLLRRMRMRPSHPLPEPVAVAQPSTKLKPKGKPEKSKKRVRDPPTRARRVTIDPTKYGSQHLKGIFLENAAAFIPSAPLHGAVMKETETDIDERMASSSSESESEDEDASSHEPENDFLSCVVSAAVKPPAVDLPQANLTPATPKRTTQSLVINRDLAEEKKQSLGLLHTLFGDADEWGGAESVGSDVEVEVEQNAIEPPPKEQTLISSPIVDPEAGMEVDEPLPEEVTPATDLVSEPEPTNGTQKTKLKDLFAPREEEAGFSLLGHLDLDLELEDDLPFDVPAPTSTAAPSQPIVPIQPSAVRSVPHTTTLDASRPFFFPTNYGNGKHNALDPTNWRAWFYRTETPEAIQARWEETKGGLTAEWKRRHREAIKSRRRRGGGDAD